jgi:hypothetical protein
VLPARRQAPLTARVRIASAQLPTWSLLKMLEIWLLIVFVDNPSLSPVYRVPR